MLRVVPARPSGPTTPPVDQVVALCACGHAQDLHEHYRAGTDCGGCECARFRREDTGTR